jgi:ABC-type Fe3+/spermidine/putrescine transport system ATPase subunit
MKYIVEVENITKKYGNVIAVSNVSFKIAEGEFFSLLGPSGCGKTTILRIIGGFIDQDDGLVRIDGSNMSKIPPNKRKTSMVFQNLALFPHMNVEDNIVYGLKKRKIQPVKISEKLSSILSVVNLKGLQKRRIDQLSGGQQQRVALARSLIIEPELLLLDEPLASLDKKLRMSMRFELKDIQKRTGTTFLYVTHDQGEALTMSDTVAVMNEGSIVQLGKAEWIYNNPENSFVADFIGAGNFIPLTGNYKRMDGLIEMQTKAGGSIFISTKSRQNYLKETSYPNYDKTFEATCKKLENGIKNKMDLYFFIRPEKVRVSQNQFCQIPGKDPVLNQYRATILSRIFEGPDTRIVLHSNEIGNITAELKNDIIYENFSEKSSAFICWNAYEGTVL